MVHMAMSFSLENVSLQTSFGEKPFILFLYLLLYVKFENLTIGLQFPIISFILAKFQEYQSSIAMLSIKCLNFKFLWYKIMYKI